MQYLGGKSAIASQLVKVIAERETKRDRCIEPFCGGAGMTVALASIFKQVRSSDTHPDLILMWQALQEGWIPPDVITESLYKELRYQKPSALRGFAGFASSYGAKWFGGYARGANDNYALTSRNGLLRDIKIMGNVTFTHSDFSKVEVSKGDIVYADPPYVMTTKYATQFSSIKFWFTVRKWIGLGAKVYVSEYRAPDDFVPVWEASVHSNMKSKKAVEKLFVFKEQA